MIISQKYCFELGYLVMILLDRVVVLNKFGIEIWKSSVNQSVGIGSFVGFDCGIKKE